MGRFDFKQFSVADEHCGMKVGTDSVLLGAWADLPSGPAHILDLGAGSGLLSLMAAQRCPQASIIAVEIDPAACADARANADASPFGPRIEVVCADAMAYQPTRDPDAVICNPPYFDSTLVSPDAQRATARHGAGFDAVGALRFASSHLSTDGTLAMVTPADGWQQLVFEAEMLRMRLRSICRVSTRAGKPATRILWQFSRLDGPQIESELLIGSPEYISLVKDFYLKL
ncbi:MAG: methyltransferase [Muribaculaceae bacterium]|nr:methyltransferase [Muribaculaceae bacterium]